MECGGLTPLCLRGGLTADGEGRARKGAKREGGAIPHIGAAEPQTAEEGKGRAREGETTRPGGGAAADGAGGFRKPTRTWNYGCPAGQDLTSKNGICPCWPGCPTRSSSVPSLESTGRAWLVP